MGTTRELVSLVGWYVGSVSIWDTTIPLVLLLSAWSLSMILAECSDLLFSAILSSFVFFVVV
jgi:hypothetical protein